VPSERCSIEEQSIEYCEWACLVTWWTRTTSLDTSALEAQLQTSALDGDTRSMTLRPELKGPSRLLNGSRNASGICD
jgi:hypothetical protein